MVMKCTAIQFFSGALALCLLLLLLSCTEVERHKVLTFFFDGVPPLGGEPNEVFVSHVPDPNAPADPNAPPPVFWSVHPPHRECATCHGERKQRTFSREVELVAQAPQLCYQCHPDLKDLPGRVHGPVAIGACNLCHNPHRTRYPHLLQRPPKEVCYGCHDEDLVIFNDSNHADESYSNCIQCHEGHASDKAGLLKKDWQKTVSNPI